MRLPTRLAFAAWLVLTAPARAQDFVALADGGADALGAHAFEVLRPLTVRVRCEGAGDGGEDEMFAYGWILEAESRRVAWSLSPRTARSPRSRRYVFEGDLALEPGVYVAYYASFGSWRSRYKIFKVFGREIGRIEIDSDRHRRALRDSHRWGLWLATRSPADAGSVRPATLPRPQPRAIVRLTGLRDGALEQRGFTLTEAMRVTVYCLGEYDESSGTMADFGWILNARTRERLWEIGPDNFRHAGGAAKNKMSRETIALPPGNYSVYYCCDGSHSHEAWNAPPPYDPESWGITLWAASDAEAARVRPYDDAAETHTIVALTRQGDDAYASQGFTLGSALQVRVYALGEFGGGTFADRGWIENFKTQERVWDMRESNTRHAGGARKNRVADEILHLPAGDYAVYYVTDDSHAYQSWNAPPPHDPTHWGILLAAVGQDPDAARIQRFVPEERELAGRDFLVSILRVPDEAQRLQDFRLERPTRVRIVALGEGLGREMFDYGWIEARPAGTVVWEMTMRNSRHGGGADKNRKFDGVVLLDRGEYRAHYATDGSHAWGSWNAPHPDTPHRWGLTVERAAGDK